jgi:HIV Tat-specific factor 1
MTGNEKSIVENTLLQIKAVEDAISENAKGILASTMKEEISELVKESLNGYNKKKSLREQDELSTDVEDEEEVEDEVEVDVEDEEEDDEEDFEIDSETEFDVEDDNQMALPPVDMTNSPMSDVLKVFKAMGDEDGIIVKKDDGGNIHLTDTNKDSEYIISMDGIDNTETQMKVETNEGVLYELSFRDDEESGHHSKKDFYSEFDESMYESEEDEEDDDESEDDGEYGGFIYDNELEEMGHKKDEVVYELDLEESFKYSKKPNMEGGFEDEVKEGPKRYGKGGNFKKSQYPSKLKKGVTEMSDEELESEWNEEEDDELVKHDEDDSTETKEASRTLGNGKYWGRNGLPKPRTAPRHIRVESVQKEMNLLKEKNEEYKKALDFFRNKLNEVAVFNSNLAYSTRLFTEHTTTKQEKINILRRFDNVETLKESKNLYKTIKNELDGEGSTNVVKESIKESVQRTVSKTPQTGSATNLIESKTYENPQFLRMKDLMTKIK